ncbi:MAG: hypothetical protein ACPG77_00310, partial [Nannocystaceae bacterium]
MLDNHGVIALPLAAAGLVAALWRSGGGVTAADPWIERFALAGVSGLSIICILASVLATASILTAPILALCCGLLAVAIWLRAGPKQRPKAPPVGPGFWLCLSLVIIGLGLRYPLLPADLGGRDQGTYALRAMHTARTGGTQLHARSLAEASVEVGFRPGPGDILGLTPLISKRHPRAGFYDGPYRPGFYLADREHGTVVPQFLHGHPSLLAAAELALGPGRGPSVLYLYALLSILVVWSLARRLWPGWMAATFATGTYVSTPIVIWVHRVPLTESFAGLLVLATALVCIRERDRRESHGQTQNQNQGLDEGNNPTLDQS